MKVEISKRLKRSRKARAIDQVRLAYTGGDVTDIDMVLGVEDWPPIEGALRKAGFKVVPMKKRKRSK